MRWYLNVVFTCTFLMTNDVDHFFIYYGLTQYLNSSKDLIKFTDTREIKISIIYSKYMLFHDKKKSNHT